MPSAAQIRSILALISGSIIIFILWKYRPISKSLIAFPNSCELSLRESDGFICESDLVWKERKHNFHFQDQKNMITQKQSFFLFDSWTPNFHCSNARRVGSMGEGGKWVCDVHRLKHRPDCLVYSAGSNGEFSFEIEMKKIMPHCEIHTFDKDYHPHPKDICIFHAVTLGNSAYPENTKNWTSLVKVLNHTERTIDILKIDIEGGEFPFFPLILSGDKRSLPKQILVEIHPNDDKVIDDLFKELQRLGYVMFAKEFNVPAGPWYCEFGFLRLNERFFSRDNI